jgi:hypothetical protein
MTAHTPAQRDIFALEDLVNSSTRRLGHPDGCDLCQYCTLLRQARGLRQRLNTAVPSTDDAPPARTKEHSSRDK